MSRNKGRTIRPDGEEEPHCPICGAVCETVYTHKGTSVVGCDNCLTEKYAYDVPDCFYTGEEDE